MSIRLRWLGTACFEIRLPDGEVLIIDPYMDDSRTCHVRSRDIERADYICITHGHFDHILDVGPLANRLGSTIFCSRKAAQTMDAHFGIPANRIRVVTAGEVLRQGPIKIEVVRATHIDNRSYFAKQLGLDLTDDISNEEMVRKVFGSIQDRAVRERLLSHMGKYPAGEQLNYIFQFPGNLRLYYFGSTPDPELMPVAESSAAQVLILQLLVGMEEAAFEVARRAGAAIVIPSHHDPFFPGQKVPDLEKVKALFEKSRNISFLDPRPGEWYDIKTVGRIIKGGK